MLLAGTFINSKSKKKKNFVSIVTVRVPLWKVFSVVTKTTIQRWHTSMAHSWLDAASGRSLHKRAPRHKVGAGGGESKGGKDALARALHRGAADAASIQFWPKPTIRKSTSRWPILVVLLNKLIC